MMLTRREFRLTWLPTVAGVLALAACGGPGGGAGTGPGPAVAAPVTTIAPASTTVYSESPGTVVATRSARIASRLSGYVHSLQVDVGDQVHAGELMLTVDNRDIEAQVAQARAALDRARAAFADAKFNYTRYSNLYQQKAVSRQEYESVKRSYETSKSGVAAAAAGLKRAEAQRAYAEVRAPFDGVVTARYVQAGDLATPGKPLVEVQAPGTLEVHSQVGNDAYAALRTGGTVNVATGNDHLDAKVLQLGPAADPATETHLLKAALPPGSGLGAGDFVRVLVPTGSEKTLLVPDTAVVTRAGLTAVFVLDESDHAHLRMVRLGEHRGDRVEVLSGLAAGARIVTRPGDDVANGVLVKPARS